MIKVVTGIENGLSVLSLCYLCFPVKSSCLHRRVTGCRCYCRSVALSLDLVESRSRDIVGLRRRPHIFYFNHRLSQMDDLIIQPYEVTWKLHHTDE